MNRFNTMLSVFCALAVVFGLASTAFAAHRGDKLEHFVKFSGAGELNDTSNLWEDATGNVRVERRLSAGGGVSGLRPDSGAHSIYGIYRGYNSSVRRGTGQQFREIAPQALWRGMVAGIY